MERNLEIVKHEGITKCSSNKGFIGNSSILPRSNFSGGGQVRSLQSLTAATLERSVPLKNKIPC